MLIAGIRYPVLSAGLGAAWCVARVIYAIVSTFLSIVFLKRAMLTPKRTQGYVKGTKNAGRGRLVSQIKHFPSDNPEPCLVVGAKACLNPIGMIFGFI